MNLIQTKTSVEGTLIKSPKAVEDERLTVHAFIKQLEDIIMRSYPNNPDGLPVVSKQFRVTFLGFYKEWLRWYTTHSPSEIWGKFGSWGPFWDKLMEYKSRANEWLAKYEKAAGSTTVLTKLPVEKEETSIIRTAVYGGLVVGGLYVAVQLFKSVRGED